MHVSCDDLTLIILRYQVNHFAINHYHIMINRYRLM